MLDRSLGKHLVLDNPVITMPNAMSRLGLTAMVE